MTQVFEDGEHPIAYVSRSLTAPEINFSVSEKELLAVKWCIKKLRPYLEGYSFTVISDHHSLKWLHNLKDPSGRLARWALDLQQWDFKIIHRKGSLSDLPDALSRYQEQLASLETVKDPWYIRRVQDVQDKPWLFPDWRVEGNYLYIHRYDPLIDPVTDDEYNWRLVVPEEWRQRILKECHEATTSAHFALDKCYDRIIRDYYWPGVYYDTRNYIRTCTDCQRHKSLQTGPQGLMGRRIVERPWVVCCADCMEFPASKRQNKYLLVFQDLFTRWVELIPLRKADGKAIARAFEDLVLFRWDIPFYLLTDNGSEFDNQHVRGVLQEYGVKLITAPPYHPQANPCERTNRTLKTMIKTYLGEDHRNWDQHLPEFRYAINSATQATTRVSPAFLNHGWHPRQIKSLRRQVEQEDNPVIETLDPAFWSERMKRLNHLRDYVIKFIDKAQSRQKKNYDKGRRDIQYEIGDWVVRETQVLSNAAKHFSAKLAPNYEEPVRIVKILSPVVYEVETISGSRIPKVHVSQLKPFHPRDTDSAPPENNINPDVYVSSESPDHRRRNPVRSCRQK